MSRGVIAENLGDGRYSVTIECDRTTGENQIDDINRQLDDLTSMESIDSELLGTWADANSTALSTAAGYQTALGHNIETWEQTQQITNEINYLNIEISLLEQQVSDAKRALDEAEREMLDAFTAYNNDEITWEEYQATVKVYQDYAANWSSLSNYLFWMQDDRDDLVEEKAELTTTDTNALLESLSTSMEQLLEITEEQSIPMYEDHADYAVPIVGTIVGLTDATIQFYSNVVNSNQEHAERSLEIQEEMSALNMDIHDLETDLAVKAHTKDQSIAAYEDALDLYWAGEMSWVELQQFELAVSSAISAYNQVESELQWKHEDMVELQQEALTLTQVNPNPIMDDITSLTEIGLYASQQRDKINMNLEALKLQKTALEKRRYEIQHILDTQDRTETIWCADYSDELTAGVEVGLIEIAGSPEKSPPPVIYPQAKDAGSYTADRDGAIVNVKVQTAAQAVYNWAMLPGWQKWVPSYRLATVTEVGDETLDVTLLACTSPAQNIDVNQTSSLSAVPVEYMSCDVAAFKVGDTVVVTFGGGNWAEPKVIGFRDHPRGCPELIMLSLYYPFTPNGGPSITLASVWDASNNAPWVCNYLGTDTRIEWPIVMDDAVFAAIYAGHHLVWHSMVQNIETQGDVDLPQTFDFAGMSDDEKTAMGQAYMETSGDDPPPLPTPEYTPESCPTANTTNKYFSYQWMDDDTPVRSNNGGEVYNSLEQYQEFHFSYVYDYDWFWYHALSYDCRYYILVRDYTFEQVAHHMATSPTSTRFARSVKGELLPQFRISTDYICANLRMDHTYRFKAKYDYDSDGSTNENKYYEYVENIWVADNPFGSYTLVTEYNPNEIEPYYGLSMMTPPTPYEYSPYSYSAIRQWHNEIYGNDLAVIAYAYHIITSTISASHDESFYYTPGGWEYDHIEDEKQIERKTIVMAGIGEIQSDVPFDPLTIKLDAAFGDYIQQLIDFGVESTQVVSYADLAIMCLENV